MNCTRKAIAWWLVIVLLGVVAVWCGSLLWQLEATGITPDAANVLPLTCLAILLLVSLRQAIRATFAMVRRVATVLDSDAVESLLGRLHSRRESHRRRALQAFVAGCGRPFGEIDCWSCDAMQLQRLIALHEGWWRAGTEQHVRPPGPASELLPGELAARLRSIARDSAAPKSTPTITARLVVLARSPLDAPAAETGARGAVLAPPSGWGLKYRRMLMSEAGLLPADDPGLPPETAIDLVEPASPPADEPSWQERIRELGDTLESQIDRVAEAIKSLLLDGVLPAESHAEELPLEDGPPLDADLFVRTMRCKIEESLQHMAAVLPEPGGSERVRAELANLLWDALETALLLRKEHARS